MRGLDEHYATWLVAEFSGILCVDEAYQGDLALLVAVKTAAPNGDRLIGYALVADNELGWYWLSTRAYDPVLARFLQPDPSELEGLFSYIYAGDNPSDLGDASGLIATPPQFGCLLTINGNLECNVAVGSAQWNLELAHGAKVISGQVGARGSMATPSGCGSTTVCAISKHESRSVIGPSTGVEQTNYGRLTVLGLSTATSATNMASSEPASGAKAFGGTYIMLDSTSIAGVLGPAQHTFIVLVTGGQTWFFAGEPEYSCGKSNFVYAFWLGGARCGNLVGHVGTYTYGSGKCNYVANAFNACSYVNNSMLVYSSSASCSVCVGDPAGFNAKINAAGIKYDPIPSVMQPGAYLANDLDGNRVGNSNSYTYTLLTDLRRSGFDVRVPSSLGYSAPGWGINLLP
jgi:RHS repeat-associated protein